MLIAILLFGLTAEAQSLADIARRERARRDKTALARLAVEGRVFTNSHLRPAPPSVQPTPSGAEGESPASEGAPGVLDMDVPGEPADPTPEEVRAAWETAVAEQRAVVQDLEDQEVRQQLEITRIRNVFVAPVSSTAEKNSAELQGVIAEAQLREIQIDLDEAGMALEGLLAAEPSVPQDSVP